MTYSTRQLLKLKKAIDEDCYLRPEKWGDDIYTSWIKYIEGKDRDTILKGTRFSNFCSLKYQFRKHPCHKKIAEIRKSFRKIKTELHENVVIYPWLLGLYYADGCIRNNSQLSFALSLHEELIEERVHKELKEILGKTAHIKSELIGNMRQIRVHSVEICDVFPKKNKEDFFNLWQSFSEKQKFQFIAGFIDGDGSCAFDVGINAIQIYSKNLPFIITEFRDLLFKEGYVSVLGDGHRLYISPKIGIKLKPFLVKKDIRHPYNGKVDVKRAYNLLKKGLSIYKIAKMLNFSKKTVHLALKQVHGIQEIKKFTDLTKRIQKSYKQ